MLGFDDDDDDENDGSFNDTDGFAKLAARRKARDEPALEPRIS